MLQGSETMNTFEAGSGKASFLKTWLQNWLSSDRRRSPRQPLPSLVAYYFTGGAPRAYQVTDISSSGFYVLTEEQWSPGTLVRMTLQRTDGSGKNVDDSIAVQSMIVRWVSEGMGLAFVVPRADLNESLKENGVDKKTLERFLSKVKDPPLVQRAAGR
jgi:PilZ domain